MLNELLVNLRLDSLDHAGNLRFYQLIQNSALAVTEGLDARSPWADSMEVHYGWLLNSAIAELNTSAYDNLKSIGFDLIRNDSVRIAIANHYSAGYDRITLYDQDFGVDHTVNLVAPVVLKRVRITEPWKRAVPLDYAALLDDLEFREVVRWKAATSNWMVRVYSGVEQSTSRLMRMIERELDARGAYD